MIYAATKAIFSSVTRIFFRELDEVDPPGADVAGRLFAANHWNGIVDPLVILATARYVASPVAKSTLFSTPGMKQLLAVAEAVPVTRRKDAPGKAGGANDEVFDRVADHLGRGRNILIFPEGVSHSEPHVLPLKTGAARMLSRAYDRGVRGLSLQAVALDFDARDTFRSRALVTYGPVHAVDDLAAAVGPGEPLVRALTERLVADLSTLVIQGQSHGELQLIRAAAEILAQASPRPEQPTLAAQAEIARAIVTQARALGPDDPRYRTVATAVGSYVHARRALGLTEAQVARDHGGFELRRLLRALGLTLLLPLALVGALLYAVPYRLPRLATRLARGEGDLVSTIKLGIGLVAFPLWSVLLVWTSFRLGRDWIERGLAIAIVLGSPWAALHWLDRLDDRRGLRLLHAASDAGLRRLARLRLLRTRAVDALRGAPQQR